MKFQILEMSDGRYRIRSKGVYTKWFWHVHNYYGETEQKAAEFIEFIIDIERKAKEATIKRIIEV